VRRGACFHVLREGAIWLRRRPETGLLGAMMEVPGTDWSDNAPSEAELESAAPFKADWRNAGQVRHVFTHFGLELDVLCATAPDGWTPDEGVWAPVRDLKEAGLPSVMMKAAKLGLETRLL
jgi:A/G-specific adenine glycosylase